MLKIVAVFVATCLVVYLVAEWLTNLNCKQAWSVAKTLTFAAMIAVISGGILATIVNLF